MVYLQNPIKIDDSGVSLFQETSMSFCSVKCIPHTALCVFRVWDSLPKGVPEGSERRGSTIKWSCFVCCFGWIMNWLKGKSAKKAWFYH